MAVYQESDLTFNFPPGWAIRKYDDHRFYRGLSGHGLKAVDFIALLPDGRLCLIEVKNYHPRMDEDGKLHPVDRKKAKELAGSLAQKYADSLRAIMVINRYYRSKWYFRWRQWFFPSALFGFKSDLLFWTTAAKRAAAPLPTTILLWLETPKAAKRYRNKIYAHLANHLNPEEAQLLLGGNGFSPLPGVGSHRSR